MKNKLRKDIQRRTSFHSHEIINILERQVVLFFQGQRIPVERYRWICNITLTGFRNFHHYCLYSDRSRGVYARLNLSRHASRFFLHNGVLTGLRHRAW